MLYVGAQQRFHILFRVIGHLLKFVDGDDYRTGGFLQIAEYLVERRFRRADVAQLQVEAGITRRVERNAALQGFDAVPETFDGFFAERLQTIDNDPAQGKYKVAQRFGRINIDEKRIIVTFDLRIVETVLYKSCLPHTARGDQRQIIAVGNFPNKILALLFAVAEILGGFVAAGYKGISQWFHRVAYYYAKIIIIK